MSQAFADKPADKALETRVRRRFRGYRLHSRPRVEGNWRPTARVLDDMARHCEKEMDKLIREGSTGDWA